MAAQGQVNGARVNPGQVIRRFGNRCLRQPCRPADPKAPETHELVKHLWLVLGTDGGVGLAAPQVGVDLRVVIIRDPESPTAKSRTTLINPEIVETFGSDVDFEEGCLSFPGLYHDVMRPRGIVVNYTDEGGHSHQVRNSEMFARIVQHEVDHLDGVLFVDHLPFKSKVWLWPRLALQLLGHLIWKLRNGS